MDVTLVVLIGLFTLSLIGALGIAFYVVMQAGIEMDKCKKLREEIKRERLNESNKG